MQSLIARNLLCRF